MDGQGQKRPVTLNIVIAMAAFIIIVAGLRAASSILIPFLLSAFIAIIVSAPMFWLRKKGVPTIVALLIVMTAVLIGVVLVLTLIGTSVDDFSQNLPEYHAQLKEKMSFIFAVTEKAGLDISTDRIAEVFNPSVAMKLVTKMLSGLGGVLTNGFLILLTVIFILLEASGMPVKIRAVLDDPDSSFSYFETFIRNIQQYMGIKTWISLGTGVIITIWLAILGVDFPFLWGLLAFLLNYITNIGSILAAVPAVMLAFIQLGGLSALLAAAGYVVVNVVMGSIVEPKVMGRGLGLSALVVFLSLVFWGWVFGPVGMLLSVPLTMTLKIAFDSSEETRWLAVILGPERVVAPVKAKEEKADK